MTKYEIHTDHFEFRFGTYKASIPAASAKEIFEWYQQETANDPTLCCSFDTLEAAQEEFRKNYADFARTRAEKGFTWWLLVGDVAWIDENTYDEDGDFDCGGDVYDFSAQGYDPEEA